MTHKQKPLVNSAPKIFFAHGPGDAAGTLQNWALNVEDDSIIAKTYSGQVFDIAKQLGSELLVITDNSKSHTLTADNISVESCPRGDMGSGWKYWLNMKKHADSIARRANEFGADVAIVSLHYGLLSLAAFRKYQIPVILDMHNTLWPMGFEPNLFKRLILKVTTMRGRNGLGAVVAVSPECGRQLNKLIGEKSIFEHIPQYPVSLQYLNVDNKFISSSENGEFRILFAGRIEKIKGVFDVLDAAEILIREGYSHVKWIFAGTGSAECELKTEIERRNLSPYLELKGQLCRMDLTEELVKANATITPTRAGFCEGSAKAPLESLIAGIPALLSSVVPASEVVKDAAIIFSPSSPAEIANSVSQMLENHLHYVSLCENSGKLKHLLFEKQFSFKNAVLGALKKTLGQSLLTL